MELPEGFRIVALDKLALKQHLAQSDDGFVSRVGGDGCGKDLSCGRFVHSFLRAGLHSRTVAERGAASKRPDSVV